MCFNYHKTKSNDFYHFTLWQSQSWVKVCEKISEYLQYFNRVLNQICWDHKQWYLPHNTHVKSQPAAIGPYGRPLYFGFKYKTITEWLVFPVISSIQSLWCSLPAILQWGANMIVSMHITTIFQNTPKRGFLSCQNDNLDKDFSMLFFQNLTPK